MAMSVCMPCVPRTYLPVPTNDSVDFISSSGAPEIIGVPELSGTKGALTSGISFLVKRKGERSNLPSVTPNRREWWHEF